MKGQTKKKKRKKKKQEKLTFRELEELMGVHRPRYKRKKGGAYRQC